MSNFINRDIFPALLEHLGKKQVTVLTGMRRTGKTTLVRKLMDMADVPQKLYFDLERLDYRELFAETNYETIVLALTQRGVRFSEKVLIAIDEIQLAPNLPSVVKYLYDHYDIKFILTGSSSYYIKNKFNESLAGRKKVFEVYPLTFRELLRFNGLEFPGSGNFAPHQFIQAEYERLKPYYEAYLQFGGFPEVVLAETEGDKKDLIADILSSYINLDIASVTDFKRSQDVYRLVKLLASRIGSKIDIAKLASLTTLSRYSIENYLYLLEQSYLIRTIPVSSSNSDREIVKARKLYFLDNGIASTAADLSSGGKFENAVFNQLHHLGDVAYYQLKTGKEIDFILNGQTAFEVKETAAPTDLKTLQRLAQNVDIEQCFVVGKTPAIIFDGYLWGGFVM